MYSNSKPTSLNVEFDSIFKGGVFECLSYTSTASALLSVQCLLRMAQTLKKHLTKQTFRTDLKRPERFHSWKMQRVANNHLICLQMIEKVFDQIVPHFQKKGTVETFPFLENAARFKQSF